MKNTLLTARDLKSEVIPVLELGEAEFGKWKHLWQTGHETQSPFLSPGYARAVAAVHPRASVCVLRCDREIVGFFAFQFQSQAHRLLGAAERIGGEMTDYCGLVAHPAVRIDGESLVRMAGLRYFLFTHLDESQAHYGLTGERRDIGLMIDLRGGNYWSGLQNRNRSFYSDTNRLRRKLEADYGPLRFTPCVQDWREPLASLVQFKRAQYKASGAEDPLEPEWTRRLLEVLADTREPESCRGVLSSLYAGDTWVSSQFSLEGRGIHHDWFPVYNRQLASYAPGRQLLWAILQNAPERGISQVDRGAGDSHAKRQFANAEHYFRRGAWARPGVRSFLYRASCSIRWRLERRPFQPLETRRA